MDFLGFFLTAGSDSLYWGLASGLCGSRRLPESFTRVDLTSLI